MACSQVAMRLLRVRVADRDGLRAVGLLVSVSRPPCEAGVGWGRKFLVGDLRAGGQRVPRVDRVRRRETAPETPEDDPMSDSAPDASSQRSWDEVHEQTKEYVTEATRQLREFFEDESRDYDARMLALLSVQALLCLDMTLVHVGALERRLGETDALLRDFIRADLKLTKLEGELRDHLEERLEHVEYATVAEGQLDRLKERLKDDLADMMANRLKGDEDS